MRVAKIAHKAPTANRAVNFECRRENHILKRQAGPTDCLRWLANAFTQFMQKLLKLTFLVYLGRVVARPFLLVGFLDCNCLSISLSLAIIRVLALCNNLNSIKVLASALSRCEVRATAKRLHRIGFNRVVIIP